MATGDSVKLVGVNLADIQIGRSGNDLVLKILSSNESLRIQNQFSGDNGVETFMFADGSSLTRAQIQAMAAIFGTSATKTFRNVRRRHDRWWGGNDYITGGGGGDTYLYGAGSGTMRLPRAAAIPARTLSDCWLSILRTLPHPRQQQQPSPDSDQFDWGDPRCSRAVQRGQRHRTGACSPTAPLGSKPDSGRGVVSRHGFRREHLWQREADTIDGKGGNDYLQASVVATPISTLPAPAATPLTKWQPTAVRTPSSWWVSMHRTLPSSTSTTAIISRFRSIRLGRSSVF
jgi:hypothetical protein